MPCVAQAAARQQALSILDLMRDCWPPEMLLPALARSLGKQRNSRATAKAIGVTLPEALLQRADKVVS